jgi:hypothetical protein
VFSIDDLFIAKKEKEAEIVVATRRGDEIIIITFCFSQY